MFGRSTLEIADSADWLATLDRFGIVSDRAALLDALSVVQNLAMPFTLEIDRRRPISARKRSAWPARQDLRRRRGTGALAT